MTISKMLQELNEDFYLAFVAPIEAEGFILLHYNITQASDTYVCNTLVFQNPITNTQSLSETTMRHLLMETWDGENAKPCFTVDQTMGITFILIPAIS